MNLNDMFPSTSLKSADFEEGGEMTLTIQKVEIRDLGQQDSKEMKPCLSFVEVDKSLVLNKTNANIIAGMYGDKNIDVSWIGKQITLHVEMTTFQGKPTPGIRVKLISEKDASIQAFWNKASGELFLTPDEGRAVLKQANGDFVAALALLNKPA
jgi:hypothetical protein